MDSRFEKVPGEQGLYYDKKTKVVYYLVRTLLEHSWCITAITPFLGGNDGRPCYYDVETREVREMPK